MGPVQGQAEELGLCPGALGSHACVCVCGGEARSTLGVERSLWGPMEECYGQEKASVGVQGGEEEA